MITEQILTDHFTSMILGVQNSENLRETEKAYIVEMLHDQLKIELQCLLFDDPTPENVLRLME